MRVQALGFEELRAGRGEVGLDSGKASLRKFRRDLKHADRLGKEAKVSKT